MSLLPKTTLEFYNEYKRGLSGYEKAAEEARAVVAEALEGTVGGIQGVTARAKSPASLLDKLRRKEYVDPAGSIRDLIGVRVITPYPDDAEHAAEALEPKFVINDEDSYDRVEQLSTEAFGYRSIHLVVRLPDQQAAVRKHISDQWFEIQIRSLLQHAWAAIEHEIQYKSGVDLPDKLGRRLASVAGGLEALDYAFMGVRKEGQDLIAEYRERYAEGKNPDANFDAARLAGCLEALRPEGTSFQRASMAFLGSGIHIEKLLRDALAMVGICTSSQFRKALDRRDVQELLRKHAASIDVTVESLSHTVVCIAVVWAENREVVVGQFPELRFDSELAATLGFEAVPGRV